jgi:hypothetical protein
VEEMDSADNRYVHEGPLMRCTPRFLVA